MPHKPFTKLSALDNRFTHHCSPDKTPEGKFLARLVVERSDGAGPMHVRITPDQPPFDTEQAAADAAYAEGERWIERNV